MRAAIAPEAVKDVPGEALGMDADQGRGLAGNVPHAQHDGFLSTGAVPGFESEDPEMAEPAGEIGLGYFLQHHRP